MRVLLLCHGRLHSRDSPGITISEEIWETGVYLDKDKGTQPDVVLDLTEASASAFRPQFDMIIGLAVPCNVYMDGFGLPNHNFWSNVSAWLRPGGAFVLTASRDARTMSPAWQFAQWVYADTQVLDRINPAVVHVLAELYSGLPGTNREFTRVLQLAGTPYARVRAWLHSAEQNPVTDNKLTMFKSQVHTAVQGTLQPTDELDHLLSKRSLAFKLCFVKAELQSTLRPPIISVQASLSRDVTA